LFLKNNFLLEMIKEYHKAFRNKNSLIFSMIAFVLRLQLSNSTKKHLRAVGVIRIKLEKEISFSS